MNTKTDLKKTCNCGKGECNCGDNACKCGEHKQQTHEEFLQEIRDKFATMDSHSIVKYLGTMHKSDCYVITRDCVLPDMVRRIREDPELYKEYQVLKQESKESWDHDHKMATMYDVDAAVTRAYQILLNVVKASRSEGIATLTKIQSAINKIEEKLGCEITDWSDKDDDEQRVKENN